MFLIVAIIAFLSLLSDHIQPLLALILAVGTAYILFWILGVAGMSIVGIFIGLAKLAKMIRPSDKVYEGSVEESNETYEEPEELEPEAKPYLVSFIEKLKEEVHDSTES